MHYVCGMLKPSPINGESPHLLQTGWRRGRDLNSRTPYEVSGFQDLSEQKSHTLEVADERGESLDRSEE